MTGFLKKISSSLRTYYFSVVLITLIVITLFVLMALTGILKFNTADAIKKIYFADNISSSHKILIEKFNKLHEGKIEVVHINLPFDKFSTNERKELLIRSLRGRSDRIDLFSVDQIWVPRFAKWAEPLNLYFNSVKRDQILDQVLQTCYYNDTLVAMPLYFDIGMMYCNNTILKKLPNYERIKFELQNSITWEKFIQLGVEMKKYGNPFYLFPADNYEGLMCSFVELIKSQNKKLFENDSIHLNSAAVQKSLQLLIDLVNKYKLSPPEITGYRETETYNYFVRNKGVFLRGWPGFYKWYRENIKDEDVSGTIDRYPLPHFEGGTSASIMGGWNLVVSKYSSNKAEVIEFIKFLLSEESQKTLYRVGGYLPVIKSIYADKQFMQKNNELSFYYGLLNSSVYRPFLQQYTRYSDVIAFYLNEAISGKSDLRTALYKAQRTVNSGDVFIK